MLDALVQIRRDRRAAERLMRKLIRKRPALLVFWSPTSSDPMARRAGAWGSRLSTASTRGSTLVPKIPISRRGDESGS